MKTKLFFFILLLVMGAGKGFAQSVSRDSLLHEIQEARNLLKNWDTIPGSDHDKCLAILTGKPVQVEDSIRTVDDRWFGVLLEQQVYYNRHIYYDETNKLLKQKIKFFQKKNNIGQCIQNWCNQIALLFILYFFTGYHRKHRTFSAWIAWCVLVGILIYFSYYLGTLAGIISLIYIFKDGIRESIENFLQKRKESKEKSKKQKKD